METEPCLVVNPLAKVPRNLGFLREQFRFTNASGLRVSGQCIHPPFCQADVAKVVIAWARRQESQCLPPGHVPSLGLSPLICEPAKRQVWVWRSIVFNPTPGLHEELRERGPELAVASSSKSPLPAPPTGLSMGCCHRWGPSVEPRDFGVTEALLVQTVYNPEKCPL